MPGFWWNHKCPGRHGKCLSCSLRLPDVLTENELRSHVSGWWKVFCFWVPRCLRTNIFPCLNDQVGCLHFLHSASKKWNQHNLPAEPVVLHQNKAKAQEEVWHFFFMPFKDMLQFSSSGSPKHFPVWLGGEVSKHPTGCKQPNVQKESSPHVWGKGKVHDDEIHG